MTTDTDPTPRQRAAKLCADALAEQSIRLAMVPGLDPYQQGRVHAAILRLIARLSNQAKVPDGQ